MRNTGKFLPFLLTIFLLFYSCGGRDVTKTGNDSSTTGWKYNDSDWGGFEVVPESQQVTGP